MFIFCFRSLMSTYKPALGQGCVFMLHMSVFMLKIVFKYFGFKLFLNAK